MGRLERLTVPQAESTKRLDLQAAKSYPPPENTNGESEGQKRSTGGQINEQARTSASMVADVECGRELQLLDKQRLIGETPDPHNAGGSGGGQEATRRSRRTEQNFSTDGCGCTDSPPDSTSGRGKWSSTYGCGAIGRTATNRRRTDLSQTDHGNANVDLLAMALPDESTRSEHTPIDAIQPEGLPIRRPFNPDPRVADYESGASLFDDWVAHWKYRASQNENRKE